MNDVTFNTVINQIGGNDKTEVATCVERLAKLVGAPTSHDLLLEQIMKVRPMAVKFYREGQPVHKAWADAMEHMRTNTRKNRGYLTSRMRSADFSCDLLMKLIQLF